MGDSEKRPEKLLTGQQVEKRREGKGK